MKRPGFTLSILLIPFLISACAGNAGAQVNQGVPTGSAEIIEPTVTPANDSTTPPADCPVTVPQDPPFAPPPPYDKLGFEGDFWYGSNSLWTAVPEDGVWASLPDNLQGYTQKIFWWRDGYVWTEEPEPDLVVTGERLDATSLPLRDLRATNAYAADIGSAMLTGVDFPTRGCWRITGRYQDAELSFVVWIAP